MTAIWEEAGSWFVWTKNGNRPKFAHPTREAASKEAERLAALNPGNKYHLMQSVAKVHVPIEIVQCAEERAEIEGTDPIDERAADQDAAEMAVA